MISGLSRRVGFLLEERELTRLLGSASLQGRGVFEVALQSGLPRATEILAAELDRATFRSLWSA